MSLINQKSLTAWSNNLEQVIYTHGAMPIQPFRVGN